MKDELIIVNHIGTSVLEAIEQELMLLVDEIKAFTQKDTVLTFNSNRAISKLKSKGFCVPTLDEILKSAIGQYEHVTIVTMHLVGGLDFEGVLEQVACFKEQIAIKVLCPLLKDKYAFEALIEHMQKIIPNEETGLLVVVHGTGHGSQGYYLELYSALKVKKDKVYLLSLLDDCYNQLSTLPEKIFIFPLFTVTGHHVQKDLFDSEKSIYNILKDSNKEIAFWRNGLLSSPEIRAIYLTLIENSLTRR